MRVFARRAATIIFDVSVIAVFAWLLANPKAASAPVIKSIYLCIKVVVPSLFIYMVLSRLVIAMPATFTLMKKLGRYGVEAVVFILGNLCGFPVGAKCALFLYESGRVSKKRAEFICSFSNNASLSFLLGFLGTALFSDIKIGLRIAFIQMTSSLITAFILRMVFMKKKDFVVTENNNSSFKKVTFTEAVTDSAYTMFMVCAFIVTFSVFSELAVGAFKISGLWEVLLRSFFEFSSGCASAVELPGRTAFVAVSISVGFSGLCVIMQVLSVIKGKLSSRLYLTGRVLNTAIFAIISLCLLFYTVA